MRVWRSKYWVAALGLALGIAIPFVSSNYTLHIMILALLYAIVASSWDLTLGYAGILNFAHPAFFALGAYGYAVLSGNFGWNPWLSLLAASGVGVAASVIVAVPVLRLRGIYVILVSFAFGQICLQIVLSASSITGGSTGLVLIPPVGILGHSLGRAGYYYLVLAILITSTFYLRILVRSTFGLSIQALRDDESYAISRGVSSPRQRMLAMMGSALFTGCAGGLYSSYLSVASPDVFGFSFMVVVLSALLVGGVATIFGPVAGAIGLTLLSGWLVELGAWRYVCLAVIIVVVLRFAPGGIYSGIKTAGGVTSRYVLWVIRRLDFNTAADER